MKHILITCLCCVCFVIVKAQQTGINGNWYSKDGSRQYFIHQQAGETIALLVSDDGTSHSKNKLILSKLREKKHKYKGLIYSADGESYTTVMVRTARHNSGVLVLKLKRMFVLDATIRWYRSPA